MSQRKPSDFEIWNRSVRQVAAPPTLLFDLWRAAAVLRSLSPIFDKLDYGQAQMRFDNILDDLDQYDRHALERRLAAKTGMSPDPEPAQTD